MARVLYRRFVLFVADDFIHVNDEETILHSALWDACDNNALQEIEHRIVWYIPAVEMGKTRALMIAAMNRLERIDQLSAMKQEMPVFAFKELMDKVVRANVSPLDWCDLSGLMHREAIAV